MNAHDIEQVVGAVMGQLMGGDLLDGDVLGAARGRGAMARLPAKPSWRRGIVTPGVNLPREGKEPLPLLPDAAGGIFVLGGPSVITFQARPQRPFQGVRLLAEVIRTGATAVANQVVASAIFIGTQPQTVQIGALSLTLLGAPTAFDVGLSLSPCEAGIDIKIPVNLVGPALAGADNVSIQMMLLGHTIQ